MLQLNRSSFYLAAAIVGLSVGRAVDAQVPLGGFIPLVGVGLTNEYDNGSGANASFFVAQKKNVPGGSPLGTGGNAYYDLALFDSGAATHIFRHDTSLAFGIPAFNDLGSKTLAQNQQVIGGATGLRLLDINDPMGVYVGGLSNRTGSSPSLQLNPTSLRGQTSFATLSADSSWALPNIIGLPIAAQHKVFIRNDQPQIFSLGDRTVRTPNFQFSDLGSGNEGITRRVQMNISPGLSFVQGPLYTFGIGDIFGGGTSLADNPESPSVISNGALFIDVDLSNDGNSLQDKGFFFDTGADLTVVSQQTAVRLGFDAILDTPDFVLQVEGSGGISSGIPGFYVETLKLDSVGGSFELHNVPVAVLDVTNPADPGNIIAGILGMNLFVGRNLVIDANPSIGQGGVGPSLYISDPVTTTHRWGTLAASANWSTAASWTAAGVPTDLWDVQVANVRGSNQEAVVAANSTVFRVNIAGTPTAEMNVRVPQGNTLTVFADIQMEVGSRLHLEGGMVDAQFVQMNGGTLSGSGQIFVGAGPVNGSVRNTGGVVSPGTEGGNPIGSIQITGDFTNENIVTLDIGGLTAGTQFDQIEADRYAFLEGSLEASLVGLNGGSTFAPQVGNQFKVISTGDGVFGEFESVSLPLGYLWDVQYNATDVTLSVIGLGLQGDFNLNGYVDAADYSMYRDTFGSTTLLAADGNLDGVVNQEDYMYWKSNFGASLAAANVSIPEPTSVGLVTLAVLAACWSRVGRL